MHLSCQGKSVKLRISKVAPGLFICLMIRGGSWFWVGKPKAMLETSAKLQRYSWRAITMVITLSPCHRQIRHYLRSSPAECKSVIRLALPLWWSWCQTCCHQRLKVGAHSELASAATTGPAAVTPHPSHGHGRTGLLCFLSTSTLLHFCLPFSSQKWCFH